MMTIRETVNSVKADGAAQHVFLFHSLFYTPHHHGYFLPTWRHVTSSLHISRSSDFQPFTPPPPYSLFSEDDSSHKSSWKVNIEKPLLLLLILSDSNDKEEEVDDRITPIIVSRFPLFFYVRLFECLKAVKENTCVYLVLPILIGNSLHRKETDKLQFYFHKLFPFNCSNLPLDSLLKFPNFVLKFAVEIFP